MKIKDLGFLLLILFLMGSCQTFRYISVDLSNPAKEELPSGIQSLTLVNRAVDKRFTDDPKDSIQLRFYESQFNLDTVIYDSQAADTLVKALGTLLYESGRYDVVIPEDRFPERDTLNPYSGEMDWKTAEDMNRRFNTDAVLSLDYYKTGIHAEFGSSRLYARESWEFNPYYAARLRINYTANLRLYYPGKKDFHVSYFLMDTLEWAGSDFDIKNLFRDMTKVKNALSETAISAAMNLAHRIAPEWNSYRRAYFPSGNTSLRKAKILVLGNDWNTALSAYMEMLDKAKSRSLRSKIEFNIALVHEMMGELDEAISWGVKSYNSYYRPVAYNYLRILKERKSLFSKSDESNP